MKRHICIVCGEKASNFLCANHKKDAVCFYCGEKHESMEVDHIIPLSRGGKDDLSNLVIACKPCNQQKSACHPITFIDRRLSGRLTITEHALNLRYDIEKRESQFIEWRNQKGWWTRYKTNRHKTDRYHIPAADVKSTEIELAYLEAVREYETTHQLGNHDIQIVSLMILRGAIEIHRIDVDVLMNWALKGLPSLS